jgi:hypothetical protein
MKNKSIILAVVGILVVGGIIFITTKNNPAPQTSSNTPIQSHRTYSLKTDSAGKTYAVNTPSEYSFSVVDEQGNTLKNFQITHTKLMHVIVARKDLKYFQHVHPQFNQYTGQFTFSDLTFPADGVYRIFADFAPGDGQKDPSGMPLPVTLSEDVPVGVGANYTPAALGSEERAKTFEGYQVTLSTDQALVSGKESALTFNLKQNGKPIIDLEEYLGALGHSVILREGNLDFIHAHPMEDINRPQTGEVGFMVDFPEAGKYKVFTQFQRAGKVFTTDFMVSVSEGAKDSGTSAPSMNHSMH